MVLPCEFIAKYVIPSLRREVVRILSEKYKMNNREIARKLRLTDAAISQYLSGKRGKKFEISREISRRIKVSAERIILDESTLDQELCAICEEIKKGIISTGR